MEFSCANLRHLACGTEREHSIAWPLGQFVLIVRSTARSVAPWPEHVLSQVLIRPHVTLGPCTPLGAQSLQLSTWTATANRLGMLSDSDMCNHVKNPLGLACSQARRERTNEARAMAISLGPRRDQGRLQTSGRASRRSSRTKETISRRETGPEKSKEWDWTYEPVMTGGLRCLIEAHLKATYWFRMSLDFVRQTEPRIQRTRAHSIERKIAVTTKFGEQLQEGELPGNVQFLCAWIVDHCVQTQGSSKVPRPSPSDSLWPGRASCLLNAGSPMTTRAGNIGKKQRTRAHYSCCCQ